MRLHLIFIFLCCLVGASLWAQEAKPAIAWEGTVHNFGRVEAGLKHGHSFRFRNSGTAPLIIRQVKISCGCLFAQYDSQPVKPGDSGEVRITYNSIGVPPGFFYKSIPVVTNAGETELVLQGELIVRKSRMKNEE